MLPLLRVTCMTQYVARNTARLVHNLFTWRLQDNYVAIIVIWTEFGTETRLDLNDNDAYGVVDTDMVISAREFTVSSSSRWER